MKICPSIMAILAMATAISAKAEMVKRAPRPGLSPIGAADSADAEKGKWFQRPGDGTLEAAPRDDAQTLRDNLSQTQADTAGPVHELWVAPDGSDANTGSSNAPLATLTAALAKYKSAQGMAEPQSKEVRIVLRDGVYPLLQTVIIQPPESGQTNIEISIEAARGAHPVLSGGVAITGWQPLKMAAPGLPNSARKHVWMANAPQIGGKTLSFRQLWVNDRKAIRARQPNAGSLARLVAWDKTNEMATIPTAALARAANPGEMEMIIDQVWEIADLRVASIHRRGEDSLLTFEQPESEIEFHHPWPPVTVNAKYQAPFFLANAVDFLDSPGEWFEDLRARKIYYWPREGENMTSAEVFAPAIESLAHIEGSLANPVTGVRFRGITFAHTTWLRPSESGHVPLQDGMYLLEARKLSPKGMPYYPKLDNVAWIGRPPAAVSVRNADHVAFIDCTFEHLASAGLDFERGTHDDVVEGCAFHDIGGNGIQLGMFSDAIVETHVPYNPSDPREICSRERLDNNVINDCANEDWGCVGMAVGYARDVTIAHNEIFDLPYTGISVGWGWTKMTNALRDNFIFANRIHEVGERLGDLGGIYLLSAQPGTVVAENAISDMTPSPYVPDPEHWYYLYLDEGSSHITVRDNWCPAENFMKNANGPGNVWTNNGPHVSETIKAAAGLEPAFKKRFSEMP